ncbi:MAG: hypothetical protein EPO21_14570 [Chloroflexota bacterium]|nr:MAG: hypothetical protein EPO21_14570 [Chloroflexota bacterium]
MTLKIGVLWYDRDSRRSTQDKIDEAIERHVEKFGVSPNTCYVHPAAAVSHDRLRIVRRANILPNHFLVGVDADPEAGGDADFAPISFATCNGGPKDPPAPRVRQRGKAAH